MAGKNWMAGAVRHPGALHRALGVPEGQPIPAAKLAAARNSSDPRLRRMAGLATTFKKYRPASKAKKMGRAARKSAGY